MQNHDSNKLARIDLNFNRSTVVILVHSFAEFISFKGFFLSMLSFVKWTMKFPSRSFKNCLSCNLQHNMIIDQANDLEVIRKGLKSLTEKRFSKVIL